MREHQIYISAKLRRRLFFLRELEKDESLERILTIDDIAGRLLDEKIDADYPQMKTLEKRLDALEGQLICELLTPPQPKEKT